jgi:hypothetical protein
LELIVLILMQPGSFRFGDGPVSQEGLSNAFLLGLRDIRGC